VTAGLDDSAQDLLRDLAPKALGSLLRRYRDFGGCEDAGSAHRGDAAMADTRYAR
jgi:hypothetical protein